MSEQQLIEGRPWFIREEFIKDANGRRPNDKEYDPHTVFIPPQEWQQFSPAMN